MVHEIGENIISSKYRKTLNILTLKYHYTFQLTHPRYQKSCPMIKGQLHYNIDSMMYIICAYTLNFMYKSRWATILIVEVVCASISQNLAPQDVTASHRAMK